ncbi:uncharacterized protein [Macrobrachium rosenbergii]|uniref:uncharacterized protein n=1 Tax=Macrobrachium rosenbergii TaxID=79674 RepID=UPI0034D6D3A0
MDPSSDEEVAAAAIVLLKWKKKQMKKRLWTRPWLARRQEGSVYYKLLRELSSEVPDTMRKWIHLSKEAYLKLLQLVTPLIEKEDTNMRDAVTAGERLTLTLRYLVAGETQASLVCQFQISAPLISSISPEVFRAIYQVLKPTYFKLPTSGDEWHQVASSYYSQWNFPMCLGALDGKRVLIAKSPNTGSEYYDYKGHFSIIMLAVVDADYKFLYVDAGACGRASDGGVWEKCNLKEAVENNLILPQKNLPSYVSFEQHQDFGTIFNNATQKKWPNVASAVKVDAGALQSK